MKLKKPIAVALPLILLVVTVVIVMTILSNPPKANFGGKPEVKKIAVQIKAITPEPYHVVIESYGTVRPLTSSSLTSQVSGQIIKISPKFREGGFFKEGDVLLELDERDYLAQVKVAQADLILAKQTLSEETAHAEQARADWKRLGKKGTPNDLVLRIPQLEAAKASVLSAQAQLDIAKLSLERTKLKAPYDGRILSKAVGLGQVVSANEALAEIYATDAVEIRLPIKNSDLGLINLPEERSAEDHETTQVLLYSDLIGTQQWQGELVRTEGAIDSTTQQLYVVAQIDHPFELAPPLIKIGQYVKANILGKQLKSVIKIPNNALYQGSYVYVEKDGRVYRRDVKLLWQNQDESLLTSGLEAGENVVLSTLGAVSSGTAVRIINDETAEVSQ